MYVLDARKVELFDTNVTNFDWRNKIDSFLSLGKNVL